MGGHLKTLENKKSVLLITGMSGSGRTFALKVFEDLGYETIDNLPLMFLKPVVLSHKNIQTPLAISIDVRSRAFSSEYFIQEYNKLNQSDNIEIQLVYFDCDDEVIARRYNETRRLHLLAYERPVIEGIRLERQLISPIKEFADRIIDTSQLIPADLRGQLLRSFSAELSPHFSIFLTSFSFRHGLPREADMIFDARLLKNPYYVNELKPLTGEDEDVQKYIQQDDTYPSFIKNVKSLLELSIPRFQKDGRNYLTIGVGCTGGQHRSVYIAETLNEWLQNSNYQIKLKHRDLKKRQTNDRNRSCEPRASRSGI